MGLGLTYSSGEGSGDITPFVKYDARAGRLFRMDRANNGDGFSNTPVDITRTFKAVLDMENIEVGYMNFNTGTAPDFVLVKLGEPLPQRPQNYKQGARLMLKLGQDCGGDVRELSNSSVAFLKGLDELHNDYVHGKAQNPGKLPVVILKDTIGVTTGQGDKKSTNYQPIFQIVGWAPRPADLIFKPRANTKQITSAAPPTVNAPPITGSTQVSAPPPAAPQRQAIEDLAAEFG